MTKGGGNGGETESRSVVWFLKQRVVKRARADYVAGKAYPPDFDLLARGDQHLYEWGRQYAACGGDFVRFVPQWNAMFREGPDA